MKKIISILSVAVIMMMAAAPAGAQVNFGLTGGVNLSKMSLDKIPDVSSNNRAGWFVGPKVLVKIPVVGLGADAAVLYSQRRMTVENNAGMTMGTVIFRRMRPRLACRMVAASSRFASIFRRVPPIRI